MRILNLDLIKKLYWGNGLSLEKISNKLNTSPQVIFYHMKKNRIPRRKPKNTKKRKYELSRMFIRKLYCKDRISTIRIAKQLGTTHSLIIQRMDEYRIKRRSLSEARLKHPKKNFSNDLYEKAYLLGLRTGDLSSYKNHNMIRISTASTHPAMFNLFKGSFKKYAYVSSYPIKAKSGYEWHMYCNLNKTFDFLIKKLNKIPISILKDKNAFFAFVAGYTDAEGSWNIMKGRKNNIWITFRLATSDFKILNQINKELRKYRINSRLYLDRKAGTTMSFGTYTNDFYALWVTQMDSICSLIDEMLKYSKHREKLYKMKLCLYAKNVISWNTIETRVISLRKKIKNEVKEYTALAKNMAN